MFDLFALFDCLIIWLFESKSRVLNNIQLSEDGPTHNIQGQDGDIWTFMFDDFLRWSWERILLATHAVYSTVLYCTVLYTCTNPALYSGFPKQIFRNFPLPMFYLYALCCTYVFLFISLFCLKNKHCGFICSDIFMQVYHIIIYTGNQNWFDLDLRFLMG